jgi:hypothetical protein
MISKLIGKIKNYLYYRELRLIEKECLKMFKIKPPTITDSWIENYSYVEYIEETVINGYKYIRHYAYGTTEYRIEKLGVDIDEERRNRNSKGI